MTSNVIGVTVKTVQVVKKVEVSSSANVGEFKIAIGKEFDADPDNLRLILSGKLLDNLDSLKNLHIEDGSTVYMVIQSAEQVADAAAAGVVPSFASGPFGDTGLTGLGGLGGLEQLAGFGLGGLGDPGQQKMIQEMMSNPSMLQSITQNPIFRQMFSNPALMQNLMASNPMMSQIPGMAQMMQNPQMLEMLQRVWSDPAFLQECMKELGHTSASGSDPTELAALLMQNAASPTSVMNCSPQSQEPGQNQSAMVADGTPVVRQSQQPRRVEPKLPDIDPQFYQQPEVAQLLQDPEVISALQQIKIIPRQRSSNQTSSRRQKPEIVYASQLETMARMGFCDIELNVQALSSANGDVSMAIERLLQMG